MSSKHWWTHPPIIRRINAYATGFWCLMAIPCIVLWRSSVLFVAIISLWANVISHYTAWVAADADVRAERVEVWDAQHSA